MPVDNDKIRALAERINGMSCGGTLLKSFGDGGHSGGRGSGPAYSGGGHSGGRSADPRDIAANSTNKYERIGNGRYWMANDSLVRSGSSPEDADRLARILAAQSALEAGWVDNVKGNNFAGYMSNGKRMSFDSPDEFWDYHIRNLDEKWPGWRRADSVKAYYDIVNNTALGLDTKEKFDAYNRDHRDNPVYIYAPAWENGNYLRDLRSVYDRYINKYVNTDFSDGGLLRGYEDGGPIAKREDFSGNIISKTLAKGYMNRHGDLTRYYFGAPLIDGSLSYSLYKPSNSSDDTKYIAINSPEFRENVIDAYFNHPELYIDERGHYNGYRHESISSDKAKRRRNQVGDSSTLSNLGVFKLGSGSDENGQYISYYDIWDTSNKTRGKATMRTEHLGSGKPFEVYDRIYLDDYYGVDSRPKKSDEYYGGYLSPASVIANAKSDGGDIHIKESKKGTFTAAAKAHGKSVQAFASQVLANKDNYSPAMVKKAVFAHNSAKWHSDGGAINKALDEGNLDVLKAAINNVLSKKLR